MSGGRPPTKTLREKRSSLFISICRPRGEPNKPVDDVDGPPTDIKLSVSSILPMPLSSL